VLAKIALVAGVFGVTVLAAMKMLSAMANFGVSRRTELTQRRKGAKQSFRCSSRCLATSRLGVFALNFYAAARAKIALVAGVFGVTVSAAMKTLSAKAKIVESPFH